MTVEDKWYELEIGQHRWLEEKISAIEKVPGGWVYMLFNDKANRLSMVFVPYVGR